MFKLTFPPLPPPPPTTFIAPSDSSDVIGELLKLFIRKMDKKSLLEFKSFLTPALEKPTKGLRGIEPMQGQAKKATNVTLTPLNGVV